MTKIKTAYAMLSQSKAFSEHFLTIDFLYQTGGFSQIRCIFNVANLA
jgi:hypothetical protein